MGYQSRLSLFWGLLTALLVTSCLPGANEPTPTTLLTPTITSVATEPGYPGPTSEPTFTPQPYPLPTRAPYTPEPPEGLPSPTVPPAPTIVPTPFVTPIPTTAPPIIPEVVGKTQQSFWIYYWQDNEIWRVDDQGQNRELLVDTLQRLGQWLTAHPMEGTDCCWSGPRVVVSPDRQKLALVVVDKNELTYQGEPFSFSIYVFDVETRSVNFVSEGVQPVWSPDSRYIAFLKEEYGGLWIADLETGLLHERVVRHEDPITHIAEYAWSADATQIAYLYNYGAYQRISTIWLIHAENEAPPRQLLNQDFPIYGITWSPDGQQIFFLSQEGGRDTSHYHSVQNLWSVSVITGGQTQLTQEMVVDTYVLSPDNQWLFMTGYHLYERSEESYDRDLWLLKLDNADLRRLTANLGSVVAADWSPDGTRLVVGRYELDPLLFSLGDGTATAVNTGTVSNFAVGDLR